MAELERRDAGGRLAGGQMTPFRQKLDGRSLDILEGEQLGHARNVVTALLVLDALIGEKTAHLAEIGIWRHLEGELGAARPLAALELQHELPDFAGEQRAI